MIRSAWLILCNPCLHIRRIGVRFMGTLQRFIRQAPITIPRHAGQEKIGLPFARIFSKDAINHRTGFIAPAKAQQHARMHHIQRTIALAELPRTRDHGDGGFDIPGVNQNPHQIIQRILILGLIFKRLAEAGPRRRLVIQGALHAPQQAP